MDDVAKTEKTKLRRVLCFTVTHANPSKPKTQNTLVDLKGTDIAVRPLNVEIKEVEQESFLCGNSAQDDLPISVFTKEAFYGIGYKAVVESCMRWRRGHSEYKLDIPALPAALKMQQLIPVVDQLVNGGGSNATGDGAAMPTEPATSPYLEYLLAQGFIDRLETGRWKFSQVGLSLLRAQTRYVGKVSAFQRRAEDHIKDYTHWELIDLLLRGSTAVGAWRIGVLPQITKTMPHPTISLAVPLADEKRILYFRRPLPNLIGGICMLWRQ